MRDMIATLKSAEKAGFRYGLILGACIGIATVGLLVIASSCEMPTEPKYRASCEAECTETFAAPLSADETATWMQRARAEVQAQADRGEIKLSKPLASIGDPAIDWRPCPWVCSGCYDTPGGANERICAAGSTSSDGKTIRISTWQRDRRGPLVQWEMRNSLWIRSGNGHLTFAAPAVER